MKKILAVAVFALGFCANAAVEKVLTIQVADKNTLIQAATKAGELVGYPMLGTMATMGLAENPINQELGEFREGENALILVYLDPDKVTKADDVANAFAGAALVYAPAKSKQDLLTSKEGLTETDGVITEKDEDGAVVYSADEKWAACGSSAEYAKLALAEIAAAQKPMDGDFVRVAFTKPFVKIYGLAIEECLKDMEKTGIAFKTMPSIMEIVSMVESGWYGLRIGDAGLDARCTVTPVAGSELSKLGLKPLEGDVLAFAPADAVLAGASAEGCGSDCTKAFALYDAIVAAVKESGVNTDWYKSVKEGTIVKVVCDVAAAVKYFKSEEGSKAADAVDTDALRQKIQAKIQALATDDLYKLDPASPASSVSISVPGADSKVSMSALFAKVLPEAAAAKPVSVGVIRYYSALKALAPTFVALVPEEANASILKAGVAALPSDDNSAIAVATYREGDDFKMFGRISAQEIRGFAALFNTGIAYFSMMQANACECDDEDLDDEE